MHREAIAQSGNNKFQERIETKLPPAFHSSFALNRVQTQKEEQRMKPEVEMRNAETQTVSGLLRKNFNAIPEYTTWIKDEVEPYLEV